MTSTFKDKRSVTMATTAAVRTDPHPHGVHLSPLTNATDQHNSPLAHMELRGARHLIPERLPSARERRHRTVGLRVVDLHRDTVDTVHNLAAYLKRLDLSFLHLKSVPEELLENLATLERLDIDNNELTSDGFPDRFLDLESLIELSAHNNKLTYIPKVIRKLKTLHRLKISNNVLKKLDGIDRLKKLQMLILDSNQLTTLNKELFSAAKRMEIMHCASNKIEFIPSDIRHMRYLRDLNIACNKLTFIQPEVFTLPRLEVLNASGNAITRIPTVNARSRKRKLNSIDLSDNQLAKFPGQLMFMTDKLDLCQNKIKSIPLSLIDKLDQVPDLELHLEDNPMQTPPEEVCQCGLRSIRQYFMEIKSSMKIYQGLKVLVLGESNQGKTSLVQTLVDQQPRLTEDERTVGVDMFDYTIDMEEGNPLGKYLNLSLYDFSGNERYLLQHGFFIQQPALVLAVFNIAEYDDNNFRSLLGRWIDFIIAHSNRLVLLPVGTHADRLPKSKVQEVCQKVLPRIYGYIDSHRKSVEAEIKRIKSRPYISPALSEQLKLYINLTKLQTHVYDKVLAVSSAKFAGFADLLNAIQSMAEDDGIFPHVLREIPTLWGEVENFVDDRGYAMQIPMMEWDKYEEEVTRRFGMKHMIRSITNYLHDTGKLLWYYDHPILKNYVFLRPSWLADVVKTVFRHDVAELDYSVEESFKQMSVSQGKLEKMKKEIIEEGMVDVDYIKSLWSNYFPTDFNKPVYEVIEMLLEHFEIGYAEMEKPKRHRKASAASVSSQFSVRSADHGERRRVRTESAGSISKMSSTESHASVRFQLDKDQSHASKKKKSKTKAKSKATEEEKQDTPVSPTTPHKDDPPPRIAKLVIPWIRDVTQPWNFREEYKTYITNPSVAAVFRFPRFTPPGFFATLIVRAQKAQHGLSPLYQWRNGLYSRHEEREIRFYLLRIEHDDGANCLRVEVRHERNHSDQEQDGVEDGDVDAGGDVSGVNASEEDEDCEREEKHVEILWKLFLPYLRDVEELISKFSGMPIAVSRV